MIPQEFGEENINIEPEKKDNKKIIILIVVGVFLLLIIVLAILNRGKILALFGKNKSGIVSQEDQIIYPDINDKDSDGISDVEEKKIGLDMLEFDTDGDGVDDKTEIEIWHTDPKKVDTDGDGIADGFEIIQGTNPISK